MSATFRVALAGQTVPFRFSTVSFAGIREIVAADVEQDISARAAKAQNGADFADPSAVAANIGGTATGIAVFKAATAAAARTAMGAAANDKLALLVDDYYETADGSDYGPAITRAFAAGVTAHKHIRLTPGANYSLSTVGEAWPDADGWCPTLFGNDATVTIAAAAGGIRFRGLKSGALANPAEGGARDLTIDANNVAGSSGIRGIAIENGGALVFENVRGINYLAGYHILNFRYADGGAPVGKITVRNCSAQGHILTGTSDPNKWYGFSDTGDLSVAMPGDAVAAGATVVIATTNTGSASYGSPNVATPYFWTNNTASPITIPTTLTAAALAAAGLTQGATTATLNGVAGTSAVMYEWYTSAGAKQADCVVQATGGTVDGFECDGGYYGAYLSGCEKYDIRRYVSDNAIRGIANEWGAKNVRIDGIVVRESHSSAVLYGYGCSGGSVDNFRVEEMSGRWVGEALFNIQLNCPNFTLGAGTINTTDYVEFGQYFIKGSVGCDNFEVKGPIKARGDCAKAYVCVESAYNSSIAGANPEHYAQSGLYDGGATGTMAGIRLRNIEIIADTTKAAHAGATAFCLMQVADAINGEVGLTDIVLDNCVALSDKHVRHFKIYEGSTAAKQINGVRLTNCLFETQASPTNAALRIILPRRWAHFALVRNVSNLDDDVLRAVPDVATPDLTYGKYWKDLGATNLNGLLGAQGASSAEYYKREIFITGGGTRNYTTVSGGSGTRDGLRLPASPIVLAATEVLHLVYDATAISWIQANPRGTLTASATVDPASLAAGASTAIATVAVAGAALGNYVDASFSNNLAGARITAWVSAADTVSYYFTNVNGTNPLDLASGTLRVQVRRH